MERLKSKPHTAKEPIHRHSGIIRLLPLQTIYSLQRSCINTNNGGFDIPNHVLSDFLNNFFNT